MCGLLASITACGGNGVNYTPVPAPPAAPAIPPQAAFSATAVTSLAAAPQIAGAVAVALPATSNVSGTVSLPVPAGGIPANAQLAQNVSNSASSLPSSIPALFTDRRSGQARRSAENDVTTPVLYESLSASVTLLLPNAPSFAFSLPADQIVSGVSYYLALYDPLRVSLGWQVGFEGPATISGTTLTFAAPSPAAPFTLTAQVPVFFAIYAVESSAPAPTPAPVISPAAPPATPAPFTLSATSVSLLAAGATATSTISDSTGYTGSYAVVSSAPSVATATVSGTTVTITAVAPGAATITVSDAQARTTTISVQVTTTALPVQ